MRKCDRIISSINSRVKEVTHKYGVQKPSNAEQAYRLDKVNGDTFWRDALNMEMNNLWVVFDILDKGSSPPPGYSKSSRHIIFDARMTFIQNDGYVRISLTTAALKGISVCVFDIQNAYLQAPTSEKYFIICGPEFGLEDVGKKAVIVRALYGGKSAGANYWRHVRASIKNMNFITCKADPAIWIRPGKRDN